MQQSWDQYYRQVINYKQRPATVKAVNLLPDENRIVAIDCGCGVGRDTDYLATMGFNVYAFDIEDSALEVCYSRFKNNPNVIVAKSSFAHFEYPKANLLLANSSLFFCPDTEFSVAWNKIVDALQVNAVFCGDFLGVYDSWVNNPDFSTTAFTAEAVRELLCGFNIVRFFERNELGKTATGTEKHWHTFSVIAVKNN